MMEFVDRAPDVEVSTAEFRRLLGYPAEHAPGDRGRDLERWARDWYTTQGRPWVAARRATHMDLTPRTLQIEGTCGKWTALLALVAPELATK